MTEKEYIEYLESVIEEYKAISQKRIVPKAYCPSCLKSFEEIKAEKKSMTRNFVDGLAYGVLRLVILVLGFCLLAYIAKYN